MARPSVVPLLTVLALGLCVANVSANPLNLGDIVGPVFGGGPILGPPPALLDFLRVQLFHLSPVQCTNVAVAVCKGLGISDVCTILCSLLGCGAGKCTPPANNKVGSLCLCLPSGSLPPSPQTTASPPSPPSTASPPSPPSSPCPTTPPCH